MTAYGVTGGPIEGFREGWAVLPFVGLHGKPHYWRRIDLTHRYQSLCGLSEDQQHYHPGARRVFAPGDFMVDRCQRCARQHERGVRRAA